MANLIMMYGNKIDTATLSGGSWTSTLPLNNVKNTIIRKVARTTNATLTSTKFIVDLGSNFTFFNSLCLIGHNLSIAAKWKITTSNDSGFATTISTTGWVDIYAAIWSSLALAWEDTNFWTGQIKQEYLDNYIRNSFSLLGTQEARYVKVEIDDTTNSAGYIQIGRVMITNYTQFARNTDWSPSLKWQDDTIVASSLGGTRYFSPKEKRRVFTFSLSELTDDEAMNFVFEQQRQLGISGEIFVIPDSEDTANSFRRSFLGRMTELSGIERHVYAHQKTAYSIEEII